MPSKAPVKGPKVTIYFKSVGGAIGRIEGYLSHIMDHKVGANVAYVKKGARKESLITSYYSSFWLVAKGWGNPDAESMWDPATRVDKGGVVTSKGRHSATSSKWAETFMRTVAKKLDVWAFYRDRKLVRSAEGRKFTRTPDDKMESTMLDKFDTLLEAIGDNDQPLEEAQAEWFPNVLTTQETRQARQIAMKVSSVEGFIVAMLEEINYHREAKAVNDLLMKFHKKTTKQLGGM
jgi:hypothetical protein